MPSAARATSWPLPGPQTEFPRTPTDICIYGGAAGGGKTVGLILEPLRHVSRRLRWPVAPPPADASDCAECGGSQKVECPLCNGRGTIYTYKAG